MNDFDVVKALADSRTQFGQPGSRQDTGEGMCIEATKYAIAVLAHLGVKARPLPCGIWVGTIDAYLLMMQGVPVAEWPDEVYSVGVAPDRHVDQGRFGGHLVVEGDEWLADFDLGRFNRPHKRIVVPAAAAWRKGGEDDEPTSPVMIQRGPEWRTRDETTGTIVVLTERRELRRWKHGSAWRKPVSVDEARAVADEVRADLDRKACTPGAADLDTPQPTQGETTP